jgi:hypothetical protein
LNPKGGAASARPQFAGRRKSTRRTRRVRIERATSRFRDPRATNWVVLALPGASGSCGSTGRKVVSQILDAFAVSRWGTQLVHYSDFRVGVVRPTVLCASTGSRDKTRVIRRSYSGSFARNRKPRQNVSNPPVLFRATSGYRAKSRPGRIWDEQ